MNALHPPRFSDYATAFATYGAEGAGLPVFELGREGKNSLHYIPFEHVNRTPKIVIVGITPGPNQVKLAYSKAQAMLRAGQPTAAILAEVKKHGAFGGPQMRPNLEKILDHFNFAEILGIKSVGSLWEENAHLLHSTSVVPHAAFTVKKGVDAPFAGEFDAVLKCSIFRECFLNSFVPSLANISGDALYLGLGRCPEQALAWCVQHGHLRQDQVLGSICHPSSNGGSTVGYFLRAKRRGDLKPSDPVRFRTDWLDAAYQQMSNATQRMRLAA